MRYLFIALIGLLSFSCSNHPTTEKWQKDRDNIVDVSDRVVEFEPDSSVLLGNLCEILIFDKYMFITDSKSPDNQIHIFDKKTLKHLASTAPIGQGPYEITNIGKIIFLESQRKFYVTDYGKLCIFSYSLDSLLADPKYKPYVRLSIREQELPSYYQPLNDSLAIARIINPTGNYGFTQYTALWNMNTMEYIPFEDLHPEIEKKRYLVGVSQEKNLLVECYFYKNLMVIRGLDGKLKYDIYGKERKEKVKKNRYEYFSDLFFTKDKIIASYSGDLTFTVKDGMPKSVPPTKLLVFDLEGNYIKTLETQHNIWFPSYDEETNRVYFYQYESDYQFAYLDLDGLLE